LKPSLPPSWSKQEALTAFGSVEGDLQAQHPDMLYSQILTEAHRELTKRLAAQGLGPAPTGEIAPGATTEGGASTSSATQEELTQAQAEDPHVAFGQSIGQWDLFPDTAKALRVLEKHFKLNILSNVDRQSFAKTHEKLSGGPGEPSPFTIILTAQDTGAYKPSHVGFNKMLAELEKIGIQKDRVLSVAQSLHHDHIPAQALGLKSVYISRAGAIMGEPVGQDPEKLYNWRFDTLGEMAEYVEKEAAGQ
jgi:HAD superfamily hydrolase (TIGR01493 family)